MNKGTTARRRVSREASRIRNYQTINLGAIEGQQGIFRQHSLPRPHGDEASQTQPSAGPPLLGSADRLLGGLVDMSVLHA